MGLNTNLFFAISLFTNNILTSSHYHNYTLEDDKLCSTPLRTKEFVLGRGNRSAAIVKSSYYFKDWPGKKSFDCRFTVKANFNQGIFAVIQRMTLRRDEDTKKCIDFIQFRHSRRNKVESMLGIGIPLKKRNDSWDRTYCGELSQYESPLEEIPPKSPLANNAYSDSEGELEVRIYVADRKVDPDQVLELQIAFTSFIECRGDMGVYKSCGENTCIFKDYFADKIVNCPYLSCKDESDDCPIYVYDTTNLENGLNTKVYVTAVSSIFLSFFLFLGCIMLCRYFEMLCWSETPGLERPTELSQVEPSAPVETPDKDLPPAYESLFPGR